jgi:exodeoxyribonuclease VII small subunit
MTRPNPSQPPLTSTENGPTEESFEHSMERLSEIVERLESGDLPLEASLQLFEEGILLAKASQARLDAAEKRVEELLSIDDDGRPVVRGMDPE